MKSNHLLYLNEPLQQLASSIAINSSPQLASDMRSFSESLDEYIANIRKETILEKLKGEDECTLLYKTLRNSLPKGSIKVEPFDLTEFKEDVQTATNYDFNTFIETTLSSSRELALPLRQQMEKSIGDMFDANQDHELVVVLNTYRDPSEPQVSLTIGIRITKNKDAWFSRKYDLQPMVTHQAPWFLEPITHDMLEVVPLNALDDSINTFLAKKLKIPYIEGLDQHLHEKSLTVVNSEKWGFEIQWLDNIPYKIPVVNNRRLHEKMVKLNFLDSIYRRFYWMKNSGDIDGEQTT